MNKYEPMQALDLIKVQKGDKIRLSTHSFGISRAYYITDKNKIILSCCDSIMFDGILEIEDGEAYYLAVTQMFTDTNYVFRCYLMNDYRNLIEKSWYSNPVKFFDCWDESLKSSSIYVKRNEVMIDQGIIVNTNSVYEDKEKISLSFNTSEYVDHLVIIFYRLSTKKYELSSKDHNWRFTLRNCFNDIDLIFVGYVWNWHAQIFGIDYQLLPDIAFVGDSIVAGNSTTYVYHQYVSANLHAVCLNYGRGGTGFVNQDFSNGGKVGHGIEGLPDNAEQQNGNNTFLLNIQNDIPSYLVYNYVINGGTNDYGASVPLDDFANGVQSVINELYSRNAHFCFLTPIKRKGGETPNRVGLKLSDYVNKIIEICNNNGVPCKDIYNNSGLNPDNSYNNSKYYSDGLHPNKNGHILIGKLCSEFIKENVWK